MTDESGMLNDTYLQKYSEQLKGLNLQQAQFTLSTTKLSSAQKEQVLVEAGLLASKDKIKASLVESALAQNLDNEAKQKEILIQAGLYDREKEELLINNSCTEAKLRETLSRQLNNAEKEEEIINTLKLNSGMAKELTFTEMLSLSVEKLGYRLGITNAQMAGFKVGVGIFAAVAAAGTAAFAFYKNYQRQMDEAVKSASETGSEVDEATKSIDGQIEKVKELREQLENSSITQEEAKNIKQELLGIQDSLVEKYGKEAESINLVNGNLKEQIGLLEELSDTELDDYFKDEENRKGIKESTKRMTDKKTYNLGNISSGSNGYDIVSDIVKDFKDKGVEFAGGSNGMSAGFTIKINADAKNAESTISDLMDKLEEAKKGADEETITQINSLLDSMSKGYSKASNIVEENETNYLRGLSQDMRTMGNDSGDPYDIYRQYAKSIDEYNEALASGEGIDRAKANYETLKQSVDSVLKKYEQFKPLFDQLEESLSEHDAKVYDFSSKFEDKSNSKLKKYADEIKNLGLQGEDLKAFNPNDNVTEDGEKAFEKLKKGAEDYGISVDELIDILEKFGYIQSEVSGQEGNENTFSLPDTETLEQQISDLNSAIDSIQSAYDTLNSAVEEYNSNGGTLSIDTIQSLLSLSNEYLACLQVENGQLSLNADAMNALAQSKLDEAQATAVTQAMTELQAIANGEAAQSTTNYISGNAALMGSLAQLSGSYEGVAKAAMTAAQAQELSAQISAASTKDKTATENVMKGLDTKLKLIQSTQNKIKSSGLGFSKKSSKNSSPTQSTTNKEKEYLDSYMTYMNKMLEGGKISYQQYAQQVSDKLEHMFKAGKISAKEYFDYTEKRLEQQKSVFDSALKAITGKLDDAIEEWQDKIKSLEKENDSYNDELDKYSSILSAIDKVYDNEINRIQDIIDGLKDANSEKERSIALEKAQWELDKARNQKTKKIYANGQYIYTTDSEAIRDAQENLNSAKLDVTISNLEKQIEVLEDFKTKWADIAKAFSTAQDEMNAKAMYGENFQYIILQNRLNDIFAFEQRYTAIEKKINDNQLLID